MQNEQNMDKSNKVRRIYLLKYNKISRRGTSVLHRLKAIVEIHRKKWLLRCLLQETDLFYRQNIYVC